MKLLLAILVLTCTVSAASADIWMVAPWERVSPDAVKVASWLGPVNVARGETESWQVANILPPGEYRVEARYPDGLTVKLYREHYVLVSKGSGTYSTQKNKPLGPGWYADGLEPIASGDTVAVTGLFPLVIWVDVKPDEDTPAGDYTVYVKVGGAMRGMRVHVWDFSIPESPTLKSAIGLWAPVRGNLDAELLLLEHRLMATFVDPAHSETLAAAGQTQAHVGGYATIRSGKVTTKPPSVSTVNSWIQKYAPLAPYSYIQDEEYSASVLSQLNTYSAAMKGRVKRMMTTTIAPASAWLDITVCLPKFLSDTLIASRLAVGAEVWLYQCLSQDGYSPKLLTDYPYANWVQMTGFLPYRYRLTGFLYWRVDYYRLGVDPWASADGYSASYPGEACWILPLDDGTFAPTIRLKWLRDGADIFDYLTMAGGDYATSVAQSVAPDFTNWSRDPLAIYEARNALGEYIEEAAR